MRAARQIAVVLALCLALLAPAMACAFPNARMTAEERACCREMKGECGVVHMPASHSCCRHGIHTGSFDAVQAEGRVFPAVVAIATLPTSALWSASPIRYERDGNPPHSPPVSPPSAVSILRI
jgi:hypothetical protein